MEVLVQHFDEVMNGFQITEIVIVDIDTNAEIESSVTTINDLKVPKLYCLELKEI